MVGFTAEAGEVIRSGFFTEGAKTANVGIADKFDFMVRFERRPWGKESGVVRVVVDSYGVEGNGVVFFEDAANDGFGTFQYFKVCDSFWREGIIILVVFGVSFVDCVRVSSPSRSKG